MCESCNNIQANQKLQVNVKNYDPTRTTVLRNAFVKDLNKRFTTIIRLINKAVIDEDCFGIVKPTPITVFAETPGHKAFQFGSSQQKVDAFMKWLNGQVDKNMLEVSDINQVGTGINNAWTNKYISDSYKRGVIRARYELQKAGFNSIPSIDATGGVNLSMTTPFHIDRLGVLYSRTYTDLKGITNAMDTQISRILSQGIADGDNPRLLAKKIVNEIDGSGTGDLATKGMSAKRRAEILARTEIIRAHHQATIQEYRNWGAADVIVEAEFTTAGDDRVCDQCKELNGKIYTLDAIQNLIPVHPQCRCIALPTLPDEDLEEIPTEVTKVDEIPVPKSAFDYMFDNKWNIEGVKKTADAEFKKQAKDRIDKAFKQHMGGVNLAELDSEMKVILKEYNIKELTKSIKVSKYDINITYEGWVNEKEGTRYEIQRVFSNKTSVVHELFELPDDLQGKGFAKGVLKSFYKQYKKAGIKDIQIYANIDVGGYAWGRYGFQAQIDDVATIIQNYTRKYGEFADEVNTLFDTWLAKNPDATHFPMNLLSDSDYGKDLLLGRSWNGQLDLTDKLQVKRFEQYLYAKKK